MTKRRRGVQACHGVLLTLLASCLVATTAFAGRISLDLRAPDATSPQQGGGKKLLKAAAPARDGVLRQGRLSAGATKVRSVNVGDILEFQLFEGVQIELTLTEQTESLFGTRSFLAAVTGYDGVRNAVVVESKDGLQVDVQNYKTDTVYTIYSDANGVTVKEFDPTVGTTIPTALTVPQNMVSSAADEADAVSSLATVATGDTRLDILVAFDKNARSYADLHGGGMTNFAQVAVQKMNAVLANTGLTDSFRFRLVGVVAVNAEAYDVHDALYAIRDNKDGWWAVEAKRNEVGADIVTTLIDTGSASGTTGVAWSLTTTSVLSFAENAYNVCAIRAVAQSNTMAHECGHNLGAGHSDRQATQPGPQLYDYSAGYYFTAEGKSYYTVMAYNSDGYGNTYTAVPYFSSPDYTYLGVPVGDAKHDNTRTLQSTFAAASGWRAQVVPTTYDLAFEPAAETVFNGPVTVTLTAENPNAVIRYTTDESYPTADSPVYTGPIILTESTRIRAIAVEDDVGGLPYEALYWIINSEGNLTIPSSVTGIGDNAFEGCSGLKSVTMPSSVTSIGECAFSGCSGLKSVTIPSRVTRIERSVFSGCTSLESVTIPSSVTSIGECAFYGCSGLKSVTIPASVMSIRPQAFEGCSGLESVTISSCAMNLPHTFPSAYGRIKEVVIFDGVTSIGDNAFDGCSGLESVAIPSSVTSIGSFAFNNCSGLQSVTIPSNVSSIGNWAFYGCCSLSGITVDENNPVFCSEDGILYNKSKTKILQCPAGKRGAVTIPSSVTSIAFSAFYGCSGLESVTIPSSVTNIESYAFEGCSGLESVTIPSCVMHLSSTFPSAYTRIRKVVICDGVASIASSAFSGCSGLQSVTIPSSVTSIASSAFSGCSGLHSVTIPSSVTSIGAYAFYDCSSLESMTIPSSVTSIGEYAFYNCSSLESVTIPSSVTSIGAYAFYNCSSLETVTIPSSVTSIGQSVFSRCSGLRSVMIPSSVTSIASSAFSGCSGLMSVMIPPCVTSLSNTFPSSYGQIKDVVLGDGVTSIWPSAFASCSGLESVTIPSSVTSIGKSAFYGCRGLTAMTIPSSVTSLGSSAFKGCSGLESVTIPSSVTSIGSSAFSGCSGLKSIVVDFCDADRVAGLLESSGFRTGSLTFVERRDPSIVIAPEVLPDGKVGEAYSVPLMVSGGKSPCLWSVRLNGAAGTSIEYIEETELSTFSSIGAAQGWRGDDSCWTYELPFAFSFYGKTYTRAYVSSNGTVTFDGSFSGYSESVQELNKHAMIAPLWDDLNTSSSDIYVSETKESVTIRWSGSYLGGGDVNFAATLYADGMIRLSYGSGNTNGGLIGISVGDGENFLVASRSQAGDMTNAGDIVFRRPSIATRVGLPKGMTLSADGVLSGTPTEVSSNVFTVVVTDANGKGNLREYAIVITAKNEPTVEGDPGATVTGDSESGFVIRPSAEKAAVEVTIPQGVDPAKVTVEVSPKVASVKANGAKVKIVSGGVDITEFLTLPAADGNGVVDLTQATVKEEFVKEALDVEKGAVIKLDAAKPVITTTETKPGLVYTFREGTTLEGFGTKAPSATKRGDGTKWSPEIKVKGGNAAFYSIGVGKGE